MPRRLLSSLVFLLTLAALTTWSSAEERAPSRSDEARQQQTQTHLERIALQAVSIKRAIATRARGDLRRAGQAGLDALFEAHAADIARLEAQLLSGAPLSVELARLREALDAVAAQRDAYSARLFWHTDLGLARAASQTSGKPILSLRMLGNLNEEFSCANSRYFRTVLYADPEVAAMLRERFVLHWSSERPVPVVTIDYGDGRVIKRPLTGNSIHYILDANGHILDALPGLYAPADFRALIADAHGMHDRLRLAKESGEPLIAGLSNEEALRRWHQDRFENIKREWQTMLLALGHTLPPNAFTGPPEIPQPSAVRASPRAAGGKSRGGSTTTRAVTQRKAVADSWALSQTTDTAVWRQLTEDAMAYVKLSPESVRHMRVKHRRPDAPNQVLSDTDIQPVVANFTEALAEDTLQNRYQLYLVVQKWLASPGVSRHDWRGFNTRVYSALFLTPSHDPWLGLVDSDVYYGLEAE